MRSRTGTALVGLAVSLLASVLLWWYLGTLVAFLFVPFVPFLFRDVGDETAEPTVDACPRCGFRTTEESFEYCPRDGTRLE